MSPALRVARDDVQPVLAVASLLAPAVATFASSPPATIKVVPDRIPAIRVEPFEDLAAGSCIPDPLRVHLGPSSVEGKLSNAGALRTRMTGAVSRCDRDWFGDVTVSVKVDAAGSIQDIRADAGGEMRTCVVRNLMREGPIETRGPGTLTIGYFMGAVP